VPLNFARSARLAFGLALTVALAAISAGPAAANSNYVYVPTQYAGPGANFLGAYEGPYDQNEGESWQHTVCINAIHHIGGIGNEWRVNSLVRAGRESCSTTSTTRGPFRASCSTRPTGETQSGHGSLGARATQPAAGRAK
jgi:hypothetical protein